MMAVVLPLFLLLAPIVAQTTLLLNATVGGSVLIPCSLPGYPLSLRWFYWQEGEQHFFHWKDGKIISIQNNEYENRTQVFNSGFGSGNISIRLDNISPEDDQKTFFALVKLDSKPPQQHCRSTLQVSAPYQDLVLTVNDTANSATCTAWGGYPEAEVSWTGLHRSNDEQLDLQGAETSLQQDPTEKTFSFTSSVNVTGLKSVTCVVYNPHSHETITKTTKIDAAAESAHSGGFGISVAITLPVLAIIGISVFRWIYIKRSKPNQQSERQTEPDGDQGEKEKIELNTNKTENDS
ncbi:CD276 antigen-like [Pagrus major]|uniref:CD276 antigen-like n=1 Tax=Pagrus major TaxID=143350 RepID=UPI003CC8D3A5